jgi:hypothetical protein
VLGQHHQQWHQQLLIWGVLGTGQSLQDDSHEQKHQLHVKLKPTTHSDQEREQAAD